ncbi:MAG TPA: hypothetical protein DHV26_06645 [Cytophagales bacterium]|nr:hypothetical protein [Cytophagales bacterium]
MGELKLHSDEQLLTALVAGDKVAFRTIYMTYARTLYNYTRKNIGVKEDCEEIVQEVFESLWARHEELGAVRALDAYLFRMVRYKIIRYFQHAKVKRKYQDHYRLFEAVFETMETEERDPVRIQQLIETSLAELPERCRMAINLRIKENLSNADIALRMNISKPAVKNYIVTAIAHLRTTFQRSYKLG